MVNRNFLSAERLLCKTPREDGGQEASMFQDQMMTLVATILVPLLLISSIEIARGASATARSIAGGALHARRQVRQGSSSR